MPYFLMRSQLLMLLKLACIWWVIFLLLLLKFCVLLCLILFSLLLTVYYLCGALSLSFLEFIDFPECVINIFHHLKTFHPLLFFPAILSHSTPLLKLPFCMFEMLSCPMGFWGFIFLHFSPHLLFLKLNNFTWLIFCLFSCAVDLFQWIFHSYYCIFEL